ncbi:hypothetical protein Bbelb_353210 [Branchiostoma belcheri]|nr:hypothetical protein Bbelb_353210 [Branchiostoma belcheri]
MARDIQSRHTDPVMPLLRGKHCCSVLGDCRSPGRRTDADPARALVRPTAVIHSHRSVRLSVISKANASEERLAAGGFIGQVLPRTEPLLRQNTKPDGFSPSNHRLLGELKRYTNRAGRLPGPGTAARTKADKKYREAAMKDEVISQFSRDSYLTGSSCSHPDLNSALLTFGVRTCEGTTASGFGCTTINYENTGRQFRPALVKDSTLRHYRVVLNQNEPRLTLRAPASPSPILSARAADRPGQARSLHYVASINSFATVKTIKGSPFNSLLNSDAILHLLNLYEGQTAAQTRKGNKFIGKSVQRRFPETPRPSINRLRIQRLCG